MKKISAFLLTLFIFAIFPITGFAQNIEASEEEVSATISGNKFFIGENLIQNISLEDSLYAIGQNITVVNPVEQDVYAIGANISISENIKDDLFMLGQNITITNTVGGDIYAAGSDINIQNTSTIDGDIHIAGENITLSGNFKGEVHVEAERISIKGNFSEDVFLSAKTYDISSEAVFQKNITYSGEDHIEGLSDVENEVIHQEKKSKHKKNHFLKRISIFKIMTWFIVSLILLLLFPTTFITLGKTIQKDIFKYAGLGFVQMMAVIFGSILILLTVFGAPLSGMTILLFAFVGTLAHYALPLLLFPLWEKHNIDTFWKKVAILMLHVIGLVLLSAIPFIGWLIIFFLWLAAVAGIFHTLNEFRK